jgi:hypothetical protein
MRVLAIVLLALTAGWAQSDEARVEAVLQQMERAQQRGDFNAFAGLWTREKSGELEQLRSHVRAQPEARYRVIKSFVHGDQAVLLAQGASADSFVTMMLRSEDGQWKIQDQLWRDTAPDPNSVYALAPPDPGAFARAGSRWDQVAPAMAPEQAASQGWQMKAVFDDAYLYIRIESSAELPAPGSTIQTPPGWPVLKIDASDAGEFVLYDAVNVGDQATFDASGQANNHRAYAAYMIRLERKGHEVFSAAADLHPSPLLDVAGRDYDIRIPLATMGILDSRATRMTIGDAQWPRSAVVSIAVRRYPR